MAALALQGHLFNGRAQPTVYLMIYLSIFYVYFIIARMAALALQRHLCNGRARPTVYRAGRSHGL